MRSENRALTWVWLVLAASTLLSFVTAGGGTAARVAGVVVLIVAALKVALVINRFMEIGRGSQGWEWFFLVWLVAVSGALVATSALA
jgi:hypothetical protein